LVTAESLDNQSSPPSQTPRPVFAHPKDRRAPAITIIWPDTGETRG